MNDGRQGKMGRPSKGGAHKVTARLADGTKTEYWYAWKGGPRIEAPAGTRAFDKAVAEAQRDRRTDPPASASASTAPPATTTVEQVVDGYLDSQDFLTCKPRTQSDYRKQAKLIVGRFGALEVVAMAENTDAVRGDFLGFRDELAKASPRQADYCLQVLNTILNWGKVRGKLKLNPLRDAGVRKVYDATRADKVWSDEQIDAFVSRATTEIALAMMLALWTGQRQGDLLRLTWSAYDGRTIKLSQGKSEGKRARVSVTIPVGAPLKKLLDATPRKSPVVLVNQDGVPWTPDGFRTMWYKTAQRAGVADRTFHDLRGTAVTKLARASCNPVEIARITGHAHARVKSILERHYLGQDDEVARNAIAKLEAYESRRRRFPKRFSKTVQAIDFISDEKRILENKTQ